MPVEPCHLGVSSPTHLKLTFCRRAVATWVLAVLVVVGWASIAKGHGDHTAIPQDKVVRVGILHSQTGTMAGSERPLIDAALMAIDEINHAGGVLGHKIEAVIEDGASDPEVFAEKAEKLITQDKVACIFGCWTSASRKAVLPVLEEYKALLWYPVQYEGMELSPYVIYTGAAPNQQLLPVVGWGIGRFGPRVFLVGSDYVFPRTANEILKIDIDSHGGEVVGEYYRPLGDSDFREVVEKIKEASPDFVLNTINGDSNRAFFEQLKGAGIGPTEIPVVSFSVAEPEVQAMGVELLEGQYAAWNYFQSLQSPVNKLFISNFKARYGEDRVVSDPMVAAYSQVYLFAKAVAGSGSFDPGRVREAARGLTFRSPGGLIRIDPENLHTWKEFYIGRVEANGQFAVVWGSSIPLRPEPYPKEHLHDVATSEWESLYDQLALIIQNRNKALSLEEQSPLLNALVEVQSQLGTMRGVMISAILHPNKRHVWELKTADALMWSRVAVADRYRRLMSSGQERNWSNFLDRYEKLDQILEIVKKIEVHRRVAKGEEN